MTIEEKAPYLDRANKYWYQNTVIIGFYSRENELEVKNAYIDGLAEGGADKDIEISELKAQIEKMKCCGNCKNMRKDFGLCIFSGGDKDYWCKARRWELEE